MALCIQVSKLLSVISRLAQVSIALILLGAAGAHAASPILTMPIRCQIGVDCFIQNYFDHDPSPKAQDYACGYLTYDGHTGTDFRLVDLPAMKMGVAVIAAASGTVAAVRDGEPDVSINQRGRSNLGGKDAGNGVRIVHGDGWETQYSHLKSGSVVVRPGQRIEAGDVLGQVGLSGNTEFPHVDFTVRKDGRPLDPFAPEASSCGGSHQGLWAAGLLAQMRYQPSGVLIAGFAPSSLTREQAEAGEYKAMPITQTTQAIAFWAELFGLQRGDALDLAIVAPDGSSLAANRITVDRNKAVWYELVGKRRGTAGWPTGQYQGRVIVHRGNSKVIDEVHYLDVQ